MKKKLALFLALILCLATLGASAEENNAQTEESDYDYVALYQAARNAQLYQAAYEEASIDALINSLIPAFELNATVDENIARFANPDEETISMLEELRTAYEGLVQIHEYDEVTYDIWEGHDELPIPGTTEDAQGIAQACLADDDGFRPILNDFRLENPESAKGTVIAIGSVRGSNTEQLHFAQIFNEFGYNVFTLEPRFNKTVETGAYSMLLLDAQRAIRYIKAFSEELQVDADKLIVIGNSKSNIAHVAVSDYFDLTPTETCEALGLTMNGYVDDEIDAIPANIAVSVVNYGSAMMLDSEKIDIQLTSSRLYSEENYAAGYKFQDVYAICGSLDGDSENVAKVIAGFYAFNANEEALYDINWEAHILNNVPHGVGAGLVYPNYAEMWNECELFISDCLNN